MKILVTELPKTSYECLFSKHSCEYGWLCSLHRPKTRNRSCPEYYEIFNCNIEKCPYLQTLGVKYDL